MGGKLWLLARKVKTKKDLHVLNSEVLKNLTVVYVPDSLVVPDFAGQQDGAQCDTFPAARGDIHLGKLYSVKERIVGFVVDE